MKAASASDDEAAAAGRASAAVVMLHQPDSGASINEAVLAAAAGALEASLSPWPPSLLRMSHVRVSYVSSKVRPPPFHPRKCRWPRDRTRFDVNQGDVFVVGLDAPQRHLVESALAMAALNAADLPVPSPAELNNQTAGHVLLVSR